METTHRFENYPIRIVILSNLVSFSIYGLGCFIVSGLGWAIMLAYLLFILIFEIRLISSHCTSCYYWGKTCGFGKGRISSWFFKRGDPTKFCAKDMTWKDMIPDIVLSLIPIVIGITLLILKFNMILLSSLLLLSLLTTFGNGYVRGELVCKFCKQKELGCPAEKLFNKEK